MTQAARKWGREGGFLGRRESVSYSLALQRSLRTFSFGIRVISIERDITSNGTGLDHDQAIEHGWGHVVVVWATTRVYSLPFTIDSQDILFVRDSALSRAV